jgi:hypothetical protein
MIQYWDDLPPDFREVARCIDNLSEAMAVINDGFVGTADLKRAALATLSEELTSDAINKKFLDLCVETAADYKTREHLKGESSDNESAN